MQGGHLHRHRRRGHHCGRRRRYHPQWCRRQRRRTKWRNEDRIGRQASDREGRGTNPGSRRRGRRIPAEEGTPSAERGQSSPRDGETVDQGTHGEGSRRLRPKVIKITTVKDKRWGSPLRGRRKEMLSGPQRERLWALLPISPHPWTASRHFRCLRRE